MQTCILYLFTVQDVLVKGLKVSVDSTYNVPASTKDGKVSHVSSLEQEQFTVILFNRVVLSFTGMAPIG